MKVTRLGFVVATLVLAALPAVGTATAAHASAPAGPGGPRARAGAAGHGDGLRLNQIQVIGTHNSYHVEATSAEENARASVIGTVAEQALEYGHPPLADQFSTEQVRQVELDVYADPAGGLYAKPLIRDLLGEGAYDPVMARPGFKVLHVQDVDYHSNCLTLRVCLSQIRSWSDAHPSHVPIAVLVELEDAPLVVPGASYQFVVPVAWSKPLLDALDAQILAVFPPRHLITPDSVRRGAATLESAVLTGGWPTIGETRGKVMFLMDNAGTYRAAYLDHHPSLRGRVLFTNSTPGQPDAAFVEENDPTGAGQAKIHDEVQRGYLVRTRADVDTVQARTGDTAQRDAALASGAQWVSTDYPVPGIAAARFGTHYVAALPDGAAVRCNPVTTTSATCTPPRNP